MAFVPATFHRSIDKMCTCVTLWTWGRANGKLALERENEDTGHRPIKLNVSFPFFSIPHAKKHHGLFRFIAEEINFFACIEYRKDYLQFRGSIESIV